MNFEFKGLNRQILALTLSIAIGVSVIIGFIGLLVFYRHSMEQVLEQNRETAVHISLEIDTMIAKAMEAGRSLAGDPVISEFKGSGVQPELERLFSAVNIFDGISVTDPRGRVIAFVPETPDIIGLDLSDRDYIREVLLHGRQVISKPLKAATGNEIVVVATPIRDGAGSITGVLNGSINLKENAGLAEIIGNRISESGIHIRIVDRQGITVYNSDRAMILKEVTGDEVVKEAFKFSSGAMTVDIGGDMYLAGYGVASLPGWSVIVEYPAKEALRSAVYLRNLMILVITLICLLVFLIVFFEAKAITRPLEALMEGVHKVSAGDYNINLAVKSQNELGVLAESFNSMVGRIKEMREDILQKQEQLEKANIELQIMAITDGLTKLYNHRYFQDCLEKAVTLAAEENKSVTLMILDIDHFKYYNDLFGHQTGDKLLEELAQLLIRELGPNDMVARYGGEEFTVILYDSDNAKGLAAGERIRAAVEAFPFTGRNQQPEGKVTVSIGIASFPENAKNKEELIRLADEALYKAKCCSRNKVELYFSVLDDLKKDLDQSEVELINSIKMLVRIINAKDKYTYGHSERVGRYVVSMAAEMGLPEEEIKIIRMGAFLHDVGKIEVSRGILMKKGPLSVEEYEIIKKHPAWGAGIIKAVEPLQPILPLIKYHHERFDGRGYPLGLKGRQIPLHARIMAVADSFDAMTSNRPYGRRKTFAEAIEEVRRCSGTQFDPEVVEVFLNLVEARKVNFG